MIPVNNAIFLPTPSSTWAHYIKGAEYCVERPGADPVLRTGFHSYEYPVGDPAAIRMFCHLNGFPALPVRKAILNGGVIY
jgi:hypothetical protein